MTVNTHCAHFVIRKILIIYMEMETVRIIRVDPKTLTGAVAQAPLEELGKVSIQKIESQVSVWRKPKAKTHGAGTAAHNRRLKKEAVLMEIAQSLKEFTARQVWEAYCKSQSSDGKCHISTCRFFLRSNRT